MADMENMEIDGGALVAPLSTLGAGPGLGLSTLPPFPAQILGRSQSVVPPPFSLASPSRAASAPPSALSAPSAPSAPPPTLAPPATAPAAPAAVPSPPPSPRQFRPKRDREPTIAWQESDIVQSGSGAKRKALSSLHPATTKRARTSAPSVALSGPSASANTRPKGKKPANKGNKAASSSSGVKTSTRTAMAPKPAASKKRGRITEEDEDASKKLDLRATKKPRVTKAPTPPKPKAIINKAPTQKLDVFVCGEGGSGELGLGNAKNAINVKRPRLNHNLSASKVGVVHVAVGGMHAAALTHDNLIYTWGVNDQGALGRDTKWGKSDEGSDDEDDTIALNPNECTPMPIPRESFPSDVVFTQLACGDSTTFALTDDGEVWGWGTFRGNDGILGFSKDVKVQSTPTKLPKLNKIKQIVCGANHTIALSEKGVAYIWGSGEQQQLGYRVLERKKLDSLTPSELRLHKKVQFIGCGLEHSFAVDKNDNIWTWGLNSFGQTGIREGAGGNKAVVFSPTRLPPITLTNGDTINCITGGAHHSAATSANGKLYVWGRLDGSQVGLDTATLPNADLINDALDRPRILIRPTEVAAATVGKTTHVTAGTDHTISINEAGEAYSWGFNVTYQCGQGGNDDEIETPTQIANTAVKDRALNWAGAGGQFSVLTGVVENGEEEEL